jgi:beta-lactamase superfamily II metal-dependent hydrolase
VKIDIFDVGHGACSAVTAPNGSQILIDCGHSKESPYWWPSTHFSGQRFEALILSNLDEDHVSDFADVWRTVPLGTVWINPTIDASRLRYLKTDGMDSGVAAVHTYLQSPTRKNFWFPFSTISVTSFYNSYGAFFDTNNLSLVTFVQYGSFSIVYPGDLEIAGWQLLLKFQNFCEYLRKVNVFVTSHHGRESGCCPEVFQLCRPDVFVISDKEKVHETQETTDWYRQHARGISRRVSYQWEDPQVRYVFTTRTDNCMSIDVNESGGFFLTYQSERQRPNPLSALAALLT